MKPSRSLAAAFLAFTLIAAQSPAALAQALAPHQQLAKDIYQELMLSSN